MMNYSDYDSDGYSSDEDADYVPSDDNLSEDDITKCELEDPLREEDDVPRPDNVTKKKRKKADISMRKRKKGVLKVDKEEKNGDAAEEPPQEEAEEPPKKENEKEERQKKKSDDLWASFLADVGTRPKDSPPASQSSATKKADSSPSNVAPPRTEAATSEPVKVTITKVFDFAGEEVRVNKEVLVDSKEAKMYLKSQEEETEESRPSPGHSSPPGPSAKRVAGMSSLMSRIGGKKPKMSTLEKSKMDWDAFKSEEGISEELAIHNRGREGYVERKNFLERVDHRQFEIEKAVRQSNIKQ